MRFEETHFIFISLSSTDMSENRHMSVHISVHWRMPTQVQPRNGAKEPILKQTLMCADRWMLFIFL